jgi:hypothetical protein
MYTDGVLAKENIHQHLWIPLMQIAKTLMNYEKQHKIYEAPNNIALNCMHVRSLQKQNGNKTDHYHNC